MVWLVVLVGVLIVLASVVIVVVSRLDHTPSWWQQVDTKRADDRDDPAVVQRAETLENAITTQMTTVRLGDDSRWSVAMEIDDLNAWLGVRLQETIENDQDGADQGRHDRNGWPSWLDRVRVGVDGDRLLIGCRTRSDSGSVVVWVKSSPEIRDGDLWIMIDSLVIGESRVPVGLSAWITGAKLNARGYRIGSATINLGDGREVKILAIRVHGGRLELMLETVSTDS